MGKDVSAYIYLSLALCCFLFHFDQIHDCPIHSGPFSRIAARPRTPRYTELSMSIVGRSGICLSLPSHEFHGPCTGGSPGSGGAGGCPAQDAMQELRPTPRTPARRRWNHRVPSLPYQCISAIPILYTKVVYIYGAVCCVTRRECRAHLAHPHVTRASCVCVSRSEPLYRGRMRNL